MPTAAHGKICYIEMPAADIDRAADFYSRVFGWTIRKRDNGETSFDDVGEVSGMWTREKQPARDPGFIISIMVGDIQKTIASILANGGEIVRSVDPAAREVTAHFRDPTGNLFGLYEHRGA